MKKVKITLNEGCSNKILMLFPSAEAAYMWSIANEKNVEDEIQYNIEKINLVNDEFIEAEWCGCQFAYEDDDSYVRLDLVRFAKAHKPKNAAKGLIVDTYSGWVEGGIIQFHEYSDVDVIVSLLTKENSVLDLPTLFGDEELTVNNKDKNKTKNQTKKSSIS